MGKNYTIRRNRRNTCSEWEKRVIAYAPPSWWAMIITSKKIEEAHTCSNRDGIKVFAATIKKQIGWKWRNYNRCDCLEGCVQLPYLPLLRDSVSVSFFLVFCGLKLEGALSPLAPFLAKGALCSRVEFLGHLLPRTPNVLPFRANTTFALKTTSSETRDANA